MILLALGAPAAVMAEEAAPAAEEGQIKEGMPAPMFRGKVLNAELAGERALALENVVGNGRKAVILSFFATYCEPCKKELPYLQALYTKYKDQGLGVMVVSIDKSPEDVEKATEIARTNNLTYPVVSDRFNIVAKRYGVKRLPCLYILDGDGKVSMVNTGYSEEFGGTLLSTVQQRLGLPADPKAVAHAGPAAAEPEAAAGDVEATASEQKSKGKGKKKGK
jgi:peroxiredoxin